MISIMKKIAKYTWTEEMPAITFGKDISWVA
jgi:hypothetical protein